VAAVAVEDDPEAGVAAAALAVAAEGGRAVVVAVAAGAEAGIATAVIAAAEAAEIAAGNRATRLRNLNLEPGSLPKQAPHFFTILFAPH
jgi:hypothetical protein